MSNPEERLTPEQLSVWTLRQSGLSNQEAAEQLGLSPGVTKTRYYRANKALNGGIPAEPTPGMKLARRARYIPGEDDQGGQWLVEVADKGSAQDALSAAVKAACEDLPRERPVTLEQGGQKPDLLNCYILTDYHFGMLAWAEETGDAWDLKIAEELLVKWFSEAIRRTPQAEVAYLAQLGDLLHFDGLLPITPAHGHVLDADTRFAKVVRTVIRAMRRVIRMLLQKYNTVVVLMADGNHDESSSVWMREFFAALYEDEPRIVVDQNPDTYYCYQHGQTALYFHHGHKRKPGDISKVFAGKFPGVFGATKHRYAHMGHLHHSEVKEDQLMVVEQHRTLAAKDAHASRGGYLSGRSAPVITYSKKHGKVSELTLTPEACE